MSDLRTSTAAQQRSFPTEPTIPGSVTLDDSLSDASPNRRRWIIGGALLVMVVIIAAFAMRRTDHTTYLTSPVQRGEIRDAVDATGTVNAVVTVLVGS